MNTVCFGGRTRWLRWNVLKMRVGVGGVLAHVKRRHLSLKAYDLQQGNMFQMWCDCVRVVIWVKRWDRVRKVGL